MREREERFQTRHPDRGKSGPRISRAKYEAVRRAILRAIPARGEGLLFKDLPGEVKKLLSPATARTLGSISWYTVVVKLDLEARGLIRRLPGTKLQRLQRSRGSMDGS